MDKKRLLALLSATSIAFCGCSLGDKTAAKRTNPADFEVSSLADLNALHTSSEQGETCEGKTIILKNDLDLTDGEGSTEDFITFQPIFAKDHEFKGTFDGNGETFNCDLSNGNILGDIAKEGIVKNLNVTGHFYGDIDSVLVGENKGTIENCKLDVVVEDTLVSLGGICCSNLGTIDGCEVRGELSTNDMNLGGICNSNGGVGATEGGTITNCKVYAKLTNCCRSLAEDNGYAEDDYYFQTPEIGGIAGFNYAYIGNCEVEGDFVSIYKDRFEGTAGGIASTNNGLVENSKYKGNISADFAGGIIGSNYGIVESCKAEGTVKGTKAAAFAALNRWGNIDFAWESIKSEPQAYLQNCEFTGTVDSEVAGVGVIENMPNPEDLDLKPQVVNCRINGEVITREADAL